MTAAEHQIALDFYTLEDLGRLVDEQPPLPLAPGSRAAIAAGARFVLEKAAEDRYIYGVNTGFGSLCETRVESAQMEKLQFNHVVSHAVGVGDIVSERQSRLALLIKLLTFRASRGGRSPLDPRFR